MLQTIKKIATYSALTFLTACGGGGGDGGASVTDPTLSFPLRQAISDYVAKGLSEYYFVTGSYKNTDGSTYTVSGELQRSKTAASSITFEGRNAVRYTDSFNGNVTYTDLLINGVKNTVVQAFPSDSSSSYWDALTYSNLGSLSSSSYQVNSIVTDTPAFIKVGQQGTLYTSIDYLNSTKSTKKGSSKSTFEVLPDAASSVLINLTEVNYESSGAYKSTVTNTFRVGLSGSFERVSGYITYANGNQTTLTRIKK